MKLDVSDVPARWQAPLSFALFAVAILAFGYVGDRMVRSLVRVEARDVIRDDREAFKAAALEAARIGAKEAVREFVAPIDQQLREHLAEERGRRLGRTESTGK